MKAKSNRFIKRHALALMLSAFVMLFFGTVVNAQPDNRKPEEIETDQALVDAGRDLFTANCTQCHAFDSKIVGPPLKDAYKNWPTIAAMVEYIKYPEKVIKSGNERAVKLFEEYKTLMPNHDQFTDDQVKSLISYIKAESINPTPPPAPVATASAPVNTQPVVVKTGGEQYLLIIMSFLLLVLAAILVVLALIVVVFIRYMRLQAGQDPEVKFEFTLFDKVKAAVFSPATLATVSFVFVMILGKAGFDAVYRIGIQQGYAPTQPIAFSHKLHAGTYEIDCGYCHSGAYQGKSATIPSVNVCMNCHNNIKTQSPEIQKLYTAIEDNKPVEWVRIHNLPDLAYFNHSQHTIVAGLECTECHGPVEEMEVVKQYAPLTMGWCINCHRETVVKTQGNTYYDKLVEFHNTKSGKTQLVVQDIGGLECSKCHY